MAVDVLAVFLDAPGGFPTGKPIRTKTALKNLINTSAEVVHLIPVAVPGTPLHEAVRGSAYKLPAGVTVTAHSPSGRKWSAEIGRTASGVFSVR